MFVRELPTRTLADLREDMAGERDQRIDLTVSDIRFDLENPKEGITLGDEVTVPVTQSSIAALSDWVGVPPKTTEKFDPDIQQYLLRTLLDRQGGVCAAYYNDIRGITRVLKAAQDVIYPEDLVARAQKVIDPNALVVESWSDPTEFRLDVIVPDNFDRGIGGDVKAGDLTKGGIRISQNVKRNLSPSVSEYLYRLVCTNGMEIVDHALKIDARGDTVEEVLAEFEAIADRAFRRVERSISSFYDLRNQKVDNPEREILRVAAEEGLADRTAVHLGDTSVMLEDAGEVTMFDVVNHITNLANDYETVKKEGTRRQLQQVGGVLVSEHVQRCTKCRSKLN